MNLLWPSNINPEPSAIARFGRILHWASIILTVMWLGGCFWGFAGPGARNIGAPEVALAVVAGAVIYFVGRGARYIFSGE